ncbi:hypothetical protein JHK85_012630 [Glycine max]|nr:hypothetical protein JHK85_012630 [Glycine max]
MATVPHLVIANRKKRPIICKIKPDLNRTFKETTKATERAHVCSPTMIAASLRMDSSGALSGISPCSVNMHNSSFFQILPRTQPKECRAQWMAR